MASRFGPMMAMNPPIRPRPHPDAILRALDEGVIDLLGSDHSPHTFEDKNYWRRGEPILATTPGWPSVETSVSVMLTAVNEGRLGIKEYVARQSEEPARAWGLYPEKGRIGPSADADITIVDLASAGRVDQAKLHSLNKLTMWHGWETSARPVYTIIAGQITALNGQLSGSVPVGKLLRPSI